MLLTVVTVIVIDSEEISLDLLSIDFCIKLLTYQVVTKFYVFALLYRRIVRIFCEQGHLEKGFLHPLLNY